MLYRHHERPRHPAGRQQPGAAVRLRRIQHLHHPVFQVSAVWLGMFHLLLIKNCDLYARFVEIIIFILIIIRFPSV